MSEDALHITLPAAVSIRLHQSLMFILVSLLTCALGMTSYTRVPGDTL